ncbi:MAG: toll/interleukin-1 receptor domain-containing protein, partial [Acidobacteriota bacterium]
MTSTIFISHSCKDHETGPPAGLPPDEITARAERLSFARKLRDEVRTGLLTIDGLEVFLDVRGGLTAGDVWQDGLHQNLRSCAGAVLLLSPEALESDWVLKEATILSWRVFLGERLVLVPVLLGVSRNDLVARGFGAISLDAIQWIEVADASDAERRSAVQQIVAALEPVASFGVRSDRSIWRSTAERWLIETARQLKLAVPEGYDETYQTQMYRALGVEAQDRDRDGDDPYQNIATFLLTSDALSILQLLGEVPTDSTLQRDTLSKKVLPLWVEALAAAQLPQAAR